MAALPNDSFAERYLPLPLIQALGSPESIEQIPEYPLAVVDIGRLSAPTGKEWRMYRGLDEQRIPFLYIEIPDLYPLIYHQYVKEKDPKNLHNWKVSSFSPADSLTLRVAEAHLKNLSEFMSMVSKNFS